MVVGTGAVGRDVAHASPEAIVFSDIVGFTEFTAVHGDARAVALIDVYEAIVRAEVERVGRVVKPLGDGFLLSFATASAAIATSFTINERCASESIGVGELWLRTGVHVGTPVHRGEDLIGHDVNLASRIADLAGAGDVLVSADARQAVMNDAVEGRVAAFREVGPVYVKGIPGPVRLYAASPVTDTW
jgi:adenylate cyclase